jgi:hypothetical protein
MVRVESPTHMEIFLNLWDELDDLVGLCRHLATSTVIEVADLARPAATLVVTLAATLFRPGS